MAALLHRWQLTENANDSVGSLNLTNNGGVTFGPDGASFNGGDQWLSGTYAIPSQFTIIAWAKPVYSGTYGAIVAAHSGAGSNGSGLFANPTDGGIQIVSNNTGSSYLTIPNEFTSAKYPSTTLTMMAFTAGMSEHKYYRGNTLVATAVLSSGESGNYFAIGAFGSNNYNNSLYNGKLSDVHIYDYPLSASEVSALYAAGPNPSTATRRRSRCINV